MVKFWRINFDNFSIIWFVRNGMIARYEEYLDFSHFVGIVDLLGEINLAKFLLLFAAIPNQTPWAEKNIDTQLSRQKFGYFNGFTGDVHFHLEKSVFSFVSPLHRLVDLQQQLSNGKKTCCLALERCCFRYNTKFGADVWMYWYRIGAMHTQRAFVVVHSNRCQQSYDSECSTVMVLRVQMPIMNSMILYYQKSVLILLYSNCIKINVEVWSILCTLYYWISPRYCFVRLSFDLFERTNFMYEIAVVITECWYRIMLWTTITTTHWMPNSYFLWFWYMHLRNQNILSLLF